MATSLANNGLSKYCLRLEMAESRRVNLSMINDNVIPFNLNEFILNFRHRTH